MKHFLKTICPPVFVGPLAFLFLWFLVTQFHLVDTFLVPGPFIVLRALVGMFHAGAIFLDTAATLYRVLVSFLIATLVGVPVGLVLGAEKRLYTSVEFLVDFFRSMPATAMFPLFLLPFGIGDAAKIAVTAFSCTLIILFNTAYGVVNAKKTRILAARTMGATRLQIFTTIVFWESLPQTFVGLRSALSLALIIIVVTEMFVGSTTGLGHAIIDAQITYEIPSMYASILLVGLMGYLLNLVFSSTEKRYLHWAGK